jgi:hypothetical protein
MRKVPCPICKGRGRLRTASGLSTERCLFCEGGGIVIEQSKEGSRHGKEDTGRTGG